MRFGVSPSSSIARGDCDEASGSDLADFRRLTADDISAAQFLYSLGNGTVSFPARNESLDFRTQLETKYRDGLRRGSSTTYVDREGDIVWTAEYYRYRVNGCTHTQAQARVFSQIDPARRSACADRHRAARSNFRRAMNHGSFETPSK